MKHRRLHFFPLSHFGVFAFCTCLLFLHCGKKSPLDLAVALQRCADEHSAKGEDGFIPGPECVVGAVIPHFECTTIKNKKINQDYFKGKISIVNFWFEGCAPCVAEVPGFNQLVRKYGKDRLRYLAVSLDPQQDVEAFLQHQDWDFDHVSNGKHIINDIFRLPWGFPTTLLVDQNGTIVKAINGGKQDSTAVTLIQERLAPSIDSLLKAE